MRLVNFQLGGDKRWGAVIGDGVVDLCRRLACNDASINAYLTSERLRQAREVVREATADFELSQLKLLKPVTQPEHIFCVGFNYAAHLEEMGMKVPAVPSLFLRASSSLVATEDNIEFPKVSEQLDYEGELVVVIGDPGRNIQEAEAIRHIAGYAIANEGSVRDWQFRTQQNFQGKNFYHSGSIGPWIVTADEVSDPTKLEIRTCINGEMRQQARLSDLVFSIPYLIALLSQVTELRPGDLILTGSPSGVGAGFKPPRWLRPGDRIEIEIAGLGVLRNRIVST